MKKWIGLPFLLLTLHLAAGQSLDGKIDADEYPQSAEFDGGAYRLCWLFKADMVYFAMQAETSGWVSIGIEPEQIMANADMVFGWVDESGAVSVVDAFSTGPVGPHPPDEELGGKADVLEFGGSQTEGITTIEFSRKLSTGDRYDRDVLKEGTLKIIWAYGESDAFEDIHVKAGYGTLYMAAPSEAQPVGVDLLLIHIILMSLSFVLMVTAMIIARYLKKRRWWLKAHRPMGITGAVLGAAGVVLAFYMVETRSAVHLRVLHSWLGLITIIAIAVTPIIGQTFLKIKKGKQLLRIMHRWFGRLSLLLMLVVIIFGLFQAGIL